METKCIKIRPVVGRTRSTEKKKESKMVTLKSENTTNLACNVQTLKKPWKKPVLLCGNKIRLFDIQTPPDDFS